MKNPLIKFLTKNYDKIVLVLILALASFYRLYRIQDYMTFLGDEGRDVLVVYNILHGDLTLLGPTASVGGFFLGPIYYYFMTPFLWLFNYNPVGPAIMVALFGIVTTWFVYKIGKEFFGSAVGLVASALYAISPLVVAYSRSSWNPNLMPFFSLLAIYLVYKSMRKNNSKLLILLGFIFGILMQLHYLSLFLGVIIFTYIFLYQFAYFKPFNFGKLFKKYLSILLGLIVGWSPFLLFEVRHGFNNVASILNFVFNPENPTGNVGDANYFKTIGDVFFRLFGRLVVNFPSSEKISSWTKTDIIFWKYFVIILGLSGTAFLIYKCFKEFKIRSENFAKYSLLLVWLFFGILLFGFYKKSIYDYYFGFMFPLPFLIVGIFLKKLWGQKIGKFIGVILLLILIWLNSLTYPFKFPPNRQLNQMREIAQFIVDKTDNKPFNFALITGGNSDHAYRYFFKIWGKDPIVIKPEKDDPQRKTVADQLFIVCEEAVCKPLGHSLWEIAGFGRAEIEKEWDVSVIKVFKLSHYKGK